MKKFSVCHLIRTNSISVNTIISSETMTKINVICEQFGCNSHVNVIMMYNRVIRSNTQVYVYLNNMQVQLPWFSEFLLTKYLFLYDKINGAVNG